MLTRAFYENSEDVCLLSTFTVFMFTHIVQIFNKYTQSLSCSVTFNL